MTSRSDSGALEAVERILNRGGDPDDVLRDVVWTLERRTGARVGVTRDAPPAGAQVHPIVWEGRKVATLWVDTDVHDALFARVAVIVSPYCRER